MKKTFSAVDFFMGNIVLFAIALNRIKSLLQQKNKADAILIIELLKACRCFSWSNKQNVASAWQLSKDEARALTSVVAKASAGFYCSFCKVQHKNWSSWKGESTYTLRCKNKKPNSMTICQTVFNFHLASTTTRTTVQNDIFSSLLKAFPGNFNDENYGYFELECQFRQLDENLNNFFKENHEKEGEPLSAFPEYDFDELLKGNLKTLNVFKSFE